MSETIEQVLMGTDWEGRLFEWLAARYLDEDDGQKFLEAARQTFAQWTRISIGPEQARILDFKQRFPSAWTAAG